MFAVAGFVLAELLVRTTATGRAWPASGHDFDLVRLHDVHTWQALRLDRLH